MHLTWYTQMHWKREAVTCKGSLLSLTYYFDRWRKVNKTDKVLRNSEGFNHYTTVLHTHVPASKYIQNSVYDFNITCFRSLYAQLLAFTQKPFLWIIMLLITFFIILICSRYKRGTSCHIYSSFQWISLSFYDTYCNFKQTSIWSASSVHGKPMHYFSFLKKKKSVVPNKVLSKYIRGTLLGFISLYKKTYI